MNQPRNIKTSDLLKFSFLLPTVLFVYNLVNLSSKYPFGDDYPAILNYLNLHIRSNSIYEKFVLLFSLHAEHQIVFCKLVSLFYYFTFKSIDFQYLVYFGNLSLIGITLILYRSIEINKLKMFFFTPVIFILFNFSFGQSIIWAMAALSNFFVVLFAFISILIARKTGMTSLILLIFMLVLTSFTFGNGVLVFLPIIFNYFFEKRIKRIFILILVGIATLYVYYYFGSILPSSRPALVINFRFIIDTILFFLAFSGSVLPNIYLALVLGSFIVIFFIYLTFSKFYLRNSTLYAMLFFLIISSIATSIGRSSFGLQYALGSRYAFYSSLFCALCYLSFLELKFKPNENNMFTFVSKVIICIIPISLFSYLIFPMRTLYETTYSAIPYSYFVYKKIKSPITNSNIFEKMYDNSVKDINSSIVLNLFPDFGKKLSDKLDQRRGIFQDSKIEFGNVYSDAIILEEAFKNKLILND